MADSDTTQQADIKKLLAEANALIANSRLKRAERAHKKLLAEANALIANRAHKKLLAEAKALIANSRLKRAEREALAEAKQAGTPSAKPFLTTSQWLSAIFIGGVLRPFNPPTNF